jgi:hypothetical protein
MKKTALALALAAVAAVSPQQVVQALPIHYCPGTEPCYEVCACPTDVAACGETDPPPCCLGSEPCAIAGPVTIYSDFVHGTGLPVEETVAVVSASPATVVLNVFQGGLVTEAVVYPIVNGTILRVSLDKSRGDFFRLYVDQQPRRVKGRQPATLFPSVFHDVQVREGATEKEILAIQLALGSTRSIIRLAPDTNGPPLKK